LEVTSAVTPYIREARIQNPPYVCFDDGRLDLVQTQRNVGERAKHFGEAVFLSTSDEQLDGLVPQQLREEFDQGTTFNPSSFLALV
jgi:hypothetical protein